MYVRIARVDNGLSYLVADHHEPLAMIGNVCELHPQVLVLPNSILLEPGNPILQIILGLAASIPCRRYHYHVHRIRRVERRERFMTPFDQHMPQRVTDSATHHQCNDRDRNDRVPVCLRSAVPPHGLDGLMSSHTNLCFDRDSAWVHRKCGSEELQCEWDP